MQKIMFNDKYGLTKAVLEGRKTMTRRSVPEKLVKAIEGGCPGFAVVESKYKVGEVVAVAQAYRDIRDIIGDVHDGKSIKFMPGYSNKMFVRADLMPYQIRITNVRVERMQDITDEDVYKEGFAKETVNNGWGNYAHHWEAILVYYDSIGMTREIRSPYPHDAFAALIDKISGNGTWESNPWVFVYEFELVK